MLVDRLRARTRSRARWWSLLVLGAGSVTVGVAMLVWPHATLRVVALVIGGWLLVGGVVRVVTAFADRSLPRDRQRMAAGVGIACAVAGSVCIGNAHATLRLLAVVLAVQWLVGGAGDIVEGLRDRRPGRRWLIAIGVLSCLLGVAFLAWPAASLLTFVGFAAVSAIGIGVLDIAAGLRLRRPVRA
jgi:uncharacterized membrane protein HdeD (DUF308 family)